MMGIDMLTWPQGLHRLTTCVQRNHPDACMYALLCLWGAVLHQLTYCVCVPGRLA